MDVDVDPDDATWRHLAEGHTMDYDVWPRLLERALPRIEKIARETFEIPVLPAPKSLPSQQIPSSPPQIQTQTRTTDPSISMSSEASVEGSLNKENDDPPTPIAVVTAPAGTLPPQLLALLTSITTTLTTYFARHPPHTVQRLAELILEPKGHHRNLPSYLHALDRVVHVTSGANLFPLPPAVPDSSSSSVLSNGTQNKMHDPLAVSYSASSQASEAADDSLGGALLTPIPWLKNRGTSTSSVEGSSPIMEGEVRTESTEVVEGPNGPGGVETVSISVNGISSNRSPTEASSNEASDGTTSTDEEANLRAQGGVTQGELLRQEQEAGVVPLSQLSKTSGEQAPGDTDEQPHARGPEEMTMEDMGPQRGSTERLGLAVDRSVPGTVEVHGIDVEAAVGRASEAWSPGKHEFDAAEGPPTLQTAAAAASPSRSAINAADTRPGTPITPKRMADELAEAQEKRRRSEHDKDVSEAKTGEHVDEAGQADSTGHAPQEDTPAAAEHSSSEGPVATVEMVDADGRAAGEPKVGERGENVGVDAADTTSR